MKKAVAMVMAMFMMLICSVTGFAAHGPLTVEQAKQAALDYAGVKAEEATFTKAYRDWDDGREVYEIEFYVGTTEYDMDVDVLTGKVTDFSVDHHYAYNPPVTNAQPGVNTQPSVTYYGYYDDDPYDYDYDDMYDRYDFDDMYDYDDMFEFDFFD